MKEIAMDGRTDRLKSKENESIINKYHDKTNILHFPQIYAGELSILLHPLGGSIGMSSHEGHTTHAMWLGPSFRIDLSILSKTCNKYHTD